ncbi:MAG: ATP-binding protein [Nannocystaceae bacterium]
MASEPPRHEPPAGAPRAGRRGLFWRIYATFLLTALALAVVVGLAVYLASASYGPAWVAEVVDALESRSEALLSAREDDAALERVIGELEGELEARVTIRGRRGESLAEPEEGKRDRPRRKTMRRLARGQHVVHERRFGLPPLIRWPLRDYSSGAPRLVAIVTVDAHRPGVMRRQLVALTLLALVLVLAAGTWPLARSLGRRLAALERGAGRIASGELNHRLELVAAPRDEIDRLSAAFNHMAARLETLVRGQKSLLANVSHELRTPVSRMRVLIEILGERVEADAAPTAADAARVRDGLRELDEDLVEMEALIADLLTSGKLELAADQQAALTREPIGLRPVLDKLAERFSAAAVCDDDLEVPADPLLLERLLANLLANARRACPDGAVVIAAEVRGDRVELSVEDEGPGVPKADRELIFEPFSRLDEARARDKGGVGLGLHLCRQIARAHKGTIHAEDRRDGARGARFVLSLPRA